jgi:hypothetical protein
MNVTILTPLVESDRSRSSPSFYSGIETGKTNANANTDASL